MKAMVLCAGLGTRLGARTKAVPKPLLPVRGEPLLNHTLRHLAAYGFTDVVINVHHLAGQIQHHVGGGERFGLRVRYSVEESLLGTAGSVKRVADFFTADDGFLVMHGDVLTDQDLGLMRDVHRSRRAPATLLLDQTAGANSLVALDKEGRITSFIERPLPGERRPGSHPWVNCGVYLFHHRFLDLIPGGRPCDFPSEIFVRAPEVELYGFPASGYRTSIDSEEEYRDADAALRDGRCVPRSPAPLGGSHP